MLKKLNEYKGVIMLVAVLVFVSNMMSLNVKHINETQLQNTVASYEK